MKVLSSIAVLAGASDLYTLSISQAEEFIGGLVTGLIQKDDLAELKTCLTDASSIEQDVERTIGYFMAGDMASILEGLESIGLLVIELPNDLSDCQDTQDDLQRISTWAKDQVADPITFLKTVATNLVKNFDGINKEVSDFNNEIAMSEYETAGETASEIIFLAVGPVARDDLYLF